MHLEEMSNLFDIHFDNVMSNQAPGLDPYEKSAFLTQAQIDIVKAYFSPELNKSQQGFDSSPIRQADFSTIIKYVTLNPVTTDKFNPNAVAYELPEDLFISLNEQVYTDTAMFKVTPISFFEYNRLMGKPYKFPPKDQAWRIVNGVKTMLSPTTVTQYKGMYFLKTVSKYGSPVRLIVETKKETATPIGNSPVVEEKDGIPTATCIVKSGVSLTDYWTVFLMTQGAGVYFEPFDAQEGHSSWPTMPTNADEEVILFDITNPGGTHYTNTVIEAIGKFDSSAIYKVRYVKKLNPIILIDLSMYEDGTLTIGEQQGPSECELPKELHEDVVKRAVELAKAAYTGDLASQIVLGQSSATEKGIITRN